MEDARLGDPINTEQYARLQALYRMAAEQRLDKRDLNQANRSLKQVQVILHQAEKEMKRVIYYLRPPTLDALGLGPAVRSYAERFERYSGIRC